MKSLYLLIDIFTVIIPFVFSFHPKINFHEKHKAFFLANFIVVFIFVTWDIVFTRMHIWGFNSQNITGIYFYNLPIEEILFFICIPYSCVFTYYCLNLFFTFEWKTETENIFTMLFASFLLIAGIYFTNKWYTFFTCLSTALLLLWLKFGLKIKWLAKFWSIGPFLLIPFLIVNGILTGTGIEEPVVWYNNQENCGIRIHTIPVEDIIYGIELIVLNLFLFEWFNSKINTELVSKKKI